MRIAFSDKRSKHRSRISTLAKRPLSEMMHRSEEPMEGDYPTTPLDQMNASRWRVRRSASA
jgi:hypothetical protein